MQIEPVAHGKVSDVVDAACILLHVDERIVAGAAAERVRATEAANHVVTRATGEQVCAGTALEIVGERRADNLFDARERRCVEPECRAFADIDCDATVRL